MTPLLLFGSLAAAAPASAAAPPPAKVLLAYSCHLGHNGTFYWSTCTYSDAAIVHWVHMQCQDPTGITTIYDQGATHPAGNSTTYSSGIGCPFGSWLYEVNYSVAPA